MIRRIMSALRPRTSPAGMSDEQHLAWLQELEAQANAQAEQERRDAHAAFVREERNRILSENERRRA